MGEDSDWAEATEALRKAATAQNLELVLDEGGAAFMVQRSPVQAKDAIGRTWQMSTIQVDFNFQRASNSNIPSRWHAPTSGHDSPCIIWFD